MPTSGGLRHWLTMSGYFNRKSCAPAAVALNRPANATMANELRQGMADLLSGRISSLLRLLEVFQPGFHWRNEKGSLSLDARRLDDRPPFLNFGFLERGQKIRRHLVRWGNGEALLGKLLLQGSLAERLHDCSIQPGDDVLGRALRRPERPPIRWREASDSLFLHGRDFGRLCEACFRQHGQCLDCSGAHLRQDEKWRIDHHINLARHHIL